MCKRLFFIFFLLISVSAEAQLQDPFAWSVDQSARTAGPGDKVPVSVTFMIPPKHYLYKNKTGLKLLEPYPGIALAPVETSPSVVHKDPFTGENEEIFENGAEILTSLLLSKDLTLVPKSVKLQLTYQGCSDKLCYRFNEKEIEIPLKTAGAAPTAAAPIRLPFQDRGFLVMLLLTFWFGIGSAFTPCVLPIIPITLAFIGVRKQGGDIGRNFFLSLVLVLSMSLTYAALGAAAALLGRSLGFLFQSPYFLMFGAALFTAFALSMFGLFEIQVPLSWRNQMAKWGGAGVWGSILSGFTVGFLAAPCVGPLIASLLLYVAKGQNPAAGFILLFAYGLGMGLIFLVIGTFYHRLAARVHGGPYMVWIKRIFGVVLLLPAFYYGSIVVQHFKGEKAAVSKSGFWMEDAEAAFAKARRENKPLFVDYFATWCFPCVQMEKGTFQDPDLQRFLNEKTIPLRVDCTEETPQCKVMVDRYDVVGWPTFLVLSPDGTVLQSYVGESLSADELSMRLKKILPFTNPLRP